MRCWSMKDAGFLLGKTGPGRNVLTFMPPLVVEREALDGLVRRPRPCPNCGGVKPDERSPNSFTRRRRHEDTRNPVACTAGRDRGGGGPVKSGPQVGEKVPGPFRPLNVTGPNAGEKVCQYCNNGANPVVMVIVRETTPAVMGLIKKVDAITAAHRDAHVGSFAVVLSEAPDMSTALKAFADREKVTTTILCTMAPAGPPSYHFAPDAAVTVVFYDHHTVRANHTFRAGELTPAATDALLADIAKILPRE